MKLRPLPTTACGGSFCPPRTITSVYSLYMLPTYTPAAAWQRGKRDEDEQGCSC